MSRKAHEGARKASLDLMSKGGFWDQAPVDPQGQLSVLTSSHVLIGHSRILGKVFGFFARVLCTFLIKALHQI